MSSLICDNYSLLIVMSRFGIKLGFGDKTIEQTCQAHGVDTNSFLAVINLLLQQNNKSYRSTLDNVTTKDIIIYLRNSHIYYLEQRLPTIRIKLLEVLDNGVIAKLMLKYFDDYVEQIKNHLKYEEEQLFPYIEQLNNGITSGDYTVKNFIDTHDHIEEPLHEFKDVIIKYYEKGDNEGVTDVIHDILSCARDLQGHNIVEDRLLVPLIHRMEGHDTSNTNYDTRHSTKEPNQELSLREQEVVRAIALGKTNKEIATDLFISPHTVMTHRKNIATKLKIHNPAGLTIYAIVNKLIDVEEVQ